MVYSLLFVVICCYSLCIRGYSVVYLKFSFYRVNKVIQIIGKERERESESESGIFYDSSMFKLFIVYSWLFVVIHCYL